jgi:hypothetical protein
MKVTMDPPKPARSACMHCSSLGCAIYARRPEPCRDFMCLWLASQMYPEFEMAADLRPDRSGVVMELNNVGTLIAHSVDRQSWRQQPVIGFLLSKARFGQVMVEEGEETHLLHATGRTERLVRVGVDPVTNNVLYQRAPVSGTPAASPAGAPATLQSEPGDRP